MVFLIPNALLAIQPEKFSVPNFESDNRDLLAGTSHEHTLLSSASCGDVGR